MTDPKRAYLNQKHNAKRRGIEWEFTYESWLAWWGGDLANRGCKAWNLQMQRIADAGPYAPSNVRKGHPKDNSKTAMIVHLNNKTRMAGIELQRQRGENIPQPSKDMIYDEDEWELEKMFGIKTSRFGC